MSGSESMQPDLDRIEAEMRRKGRLSEEFEMLWQAAAVNEVGGIIETHRVLDVAYWKERGVSFTGSPAIGFRIYLKGRFPDEYERKNEVAKWSETDLALDGPLTEMVFRLLCDERTYAEIEGDLATYMLAYDGTRIERGDLILRIEATAKVIFERFGVSDGRSLIGEVMRRGLFADNSPPGDPHGRV